MEIEKVAPIPSWNDLDVLTLQAQLALRKQNIELFAKKWEDRQALERSNSLEVNSFGALKEICHTLRFRGSHNSYEEHAKYLWVHENAHKNAATRRGVSSTIRISKIQERFGFDYSSYLDISVADLIKAAKGKPRLVIQYMGELFVAPDKKGVGYAEETIVGRELLAKARSLMLKEVLGIK